MASIDWNGRITSYLQKTGTVPAGASEIIATLGAACQSAVERLIGRTFDNVSYTELYDGNDRRTLFLRHDPVVSISAITVDGSPVTTGYVIEPTKQGIMLTDGSAFTFGTQNVGVTYTAGLTSPDTSSPPDGLLFAVTYWAAQFFRGRDRVGESSSSIGGQITQFSQDIPKDVRLMFMSYSRLVIPC